MRASILPGKWSSMQKPRHRSHVIPGGWCNRRPETTMLLYDCRVTSRPGIWWHAGVAASFVSVTNRRDLWHVSYPILMNPSDSGFRRPYFRKYALQFLHILAIEFCGGPINNYVRRLNRPVQHAAAGGGEVNTVANTAKNKRKIRVFSHLQSLTKVTFPAECDQFFYQLSLPFMSK